MTSNNPRQVKHLLRILDTMTDFELVICAYRSPTVFREMLKLTEDHCRVRAFTTVTVDLSPLDRVGEFENLLAEASTETSTNESLDKPSYRVFNIIGLERHVKNDIQSSFLNHLNLIRDRLAADYPYGFFFWLPENLVKRFMLDAPDVWAWRNTLLTFEEDQERHSAQNDQPMAIPLESFGEGNFESLTLEEKQRELQFLEKSLSPPPAMRSSLKGQKKIAALYNRLGGIYYSLGRYDRALDCYEKSLEIENQLGQRGRIALAYNNIGNSLYGQKKYDRALEHLEKSLELFMLAEDGDAAGRIYNNIGTLYTARGEYERGFEYFEKSREALGADGDDPGSAVPCQNIGLVHQSRGDHDAALGALAKALVIFRQTHRPHQESVTLNNISLVYYARGDYDAAVDCLEKGLAISRKTGHTPTQISILHNLALIYVQKGRKQEALELRKQASNLLKKSKDKQS